MHILLGCCPNDGQALTPLQGVQVLEARFHSKTPNASEYGTLSTTQRRGAMLGAARSSSQLFQPARFQSLTLLALSLTILTFSVGLPRALLDLAADLFVRFGRCSSKSAANPFRNCQGLSSGKPSRHQAHIQSHWWRGKDLTSRQLLKVLRIQSVPVSQPRCLASKKRRAVVPRIGRPSKALGSSKTPSPRCHCLWGPPKRERGSRRKVPAAYVRRSPSCAPHTTA